MASAIDASEISHGNPNIRKKKGHPVFHLGVNQAAEVNTSNHLRGWSPQFMSCLHCSP